MDKIAEENVLAVEGKDEKNFFAALLKTLDIHNVQIIDVGGKDNFKNKFPVYIQSEGALDRIKNIGFVRDAEEHEAMAAFQSVCSILKKYKLPCPEEPCKITPSNEKKVGVFIMPNNNACGMLEDLCIDSIKETDVFGCVECFIHCYENKVEKDKYNIAKARILAYLSTRIPIVNSLGLAAQQGVWDFSNQCFDDIKKFLKDLFE
ncbi:MAG: hypothetical protein LBG05_05905 [Treponema sp.]|jgi:hypothetical protein|nr:hypothetical protein [Treponema sp.]